MIEQKNVLVAVAISIVILVGWQYFYERPRLEKRQAQIEMQRQADQGAANQGQPVAGQQAGTPPAAAGNTAGQGAGTAPGLGPNLGAAGQAAQATAGATREAALKKTPRVTIRSRRVIGSISLVGGRIDDIVLRDYRETLDKDSTNIVVLRPTQGEKPYYAEFGWLAKDVKTPSAETLWRTNSTVLSPESPLTLRWDNGEGLIFENTYSLDDNFMIRVQQRVRNNTGKPVTLTPYGLISRTGTPKLLGYYILHEGLIGVLNETLKEIKYKAVREDGPEQFTSTGGWLGITDKYWLAALVPDQKQEIKARFIAGKRGSDDLYQTDYLYKPLVAPAGGTVEANGRVFAGAKEVKLLDKYEAELGIPLFDKAVDFGWFYFLTKPIFYALDWLYAFLGNFGLAILALTISIKLVLFPLANKSYVSMSKMKKLQPKLVELRERFADDKQRLNQEMMALYKKEGANPAAGCLPIVIQIPVFFSLYKVLFVNIEMRHAPFYGWIHDLSAPDPLGLLTLFGLIQWDVPTSLHIVNIGIWPLIMGITMFLQQKLNPAPTDPIQAKVFMFMPIIFTFLLARFPAGLVIYWAWNNILSMSQQWFIMRRVGVSVSGGPSGSGKTGSAKTGSGKTGGGKTGGGKTGGGKTGTASGSSAKSGKKKAAGGKT